MKSIHQKIAAIRKKIGKISKDQTNPFHNSKYFDINKLIDVVDPLLHEEGLLLLQPIQSGEVCTVIVDLETGEKISSSMTMPEFTNPQHAGSCVTYYRRYTLQSLLALQAEDDDGNMGAKPVKQAEKSESAANNKEVTEWLTKDQFDKAMDSGTAEQIQNCLNLYNGKSGKGMKKEYRKELTERMNQLKNQSK